MHDGDGDGDLLGLLDAHHQHHRLADKTQAGTTRQTFKRESTFVALERTKCKLWFSAGGQNLQTFHAVEGKRMFSIFISEPLNIWNEKKISANGNLDSGNFGGGAKDDNIIIMTIFFSYNDRVVSISAMRRHLIKKV